MEYKGKKWRLNQKASSSGHKRTKLGNHKYNWKILSTILQYHPEPPCKYLAISGYLTLNFFRFTLHNITKHYITWMSPRTSFHLLKISIDRVKWSQFQKSSWVVVVKAAVNVDIKNEVICNRMQCFQFKSYWQSDKLLNSPEYWKTIPSNQKLAMLWLAIEKIILVSFTDTKRHSPIIWNSCCRTIRWRNLKISHV